MLCRAEMDILDRILCAMYTMTWHQSRPDHLAVLRKK